MAADAVFHHIVFKFTGDQLAGRVLLGYPHPPVGVGVTLIAIDLQRNHPLAGLISALLQQLLEARPAGRGLSLLEAAVHSLAGARKIKALAGYALLGRD